MQRLLPLYMFIHIFKRFEEKIAVTFSAYTKSQAHMGIFLKLIHYLIFHICHFHKIDDKQKTWRTEKIIKSAHGNKVRPIIEAIVEIAGMRLKSEFSLADRRHLKYNMLIGQNILKKGFLIDPSK